MNKFKVAEFSDRGIRDNNQDSHLVFKNSYGNLFAMVADGMGGHVGGQIASKFAVKTMNEYFKKVDLNILDEASIKHQLTKAIMFLQREFKRIAFEKPEFTDMGTTLNMNVFVEDYLYTINVGDSRSSIIDTNGLKQISEDHNLAQLAKVDKRFERFAEDTNLLTSSLGPTKETNVDIFKTKLSIDGYLVITSDGIHQFVDESTLERIIMDENLSLSKKTKEIAKVAQSNFTNDNMTIVVVKYGN